MSDRERSILFGKMVEGTATDEEKQRFEHLAAQRLKSMVRPSLADLLKQQARRNVLRPAKPRSRRDD